MIPTPVLSEVLVHAGDAGPRFLELLGENRWFRIEAFDRRAAVELAAMTHDALVAGDLRAGTDATRAKLKFDRQIIAIALTRGETIIYSADGDIARLGRTLGLEVVRSHELPRRPEDPQLPLDLPPVGDR